MRHVLHITSGDALSRLMRRWAVVGKQFFWHHDDQIRKFTAWQVK